MRTSLSTVCHLLASAVLLAFHVVCLAQTAPAPSPPGSAAADNSLGTAARNAKVQKAHAKKVFTDDDMDATREPLPKMTIDGEENTNEVVAAITLYKGSHTAQQTEEVVRTWYERYDQVLAAAIQENLEIAALRNANVSNGNELCQESQDYRQCQNRQLAEQLGARNDQIEMRKNNNLIVRIQQSFIKVRRGMFQHGIRYDWFKVRTSNGVDYY